MDDILPPRRWVGLAVGSLRFQAIRCGLFAIAIGVLYQAVYLSCLHYGPGWTGRENGPIEVAEALLAVTGGLLVLAAANRAGMASGGALLTCIALVLFYGAAREMDQSFETMFFNDAYKWIVGLPAGLAIVLVVVSYRDQIFKQAKEFVQQPEATVLVIAGVFLVLVVQVLDRPGIWRGLETHPARAGLVGFVEESMELFGYALVAMAGLESYLSVAGFGADGKRADQGSDEVSLSVLISENDSAAA